MSPGTATSMKAEQAAALNGAMDFLLLTTTCTGILIPVSVALFFSFSRIWRTPVFVLNVIAIALGFAYGGLTINYLVRSPYPYDSAISSDAHICPEPCCSPRNRSSPGGSHPRASH